MKHKALIKWFSIEEVELPDDMDPITFPVEAREHVWTQTMPDSPTNPRPSEVVFVREDLVAVNVGGWQMVKTRGDIFESEANYIVNPINTVGIMGGGLAKQFKIRYPLMYEEYRLACEAKVVVTGLMWTWTEAPGKYIVNFPTKRHWRDPSRYKYITDGLQDMSLMTVDMIPEERSIAMPMLGCGLGGLDKEVVEHMIKEALPGFTGQGVLYLYDN